jgi:hypothetical protein
MSLTLNQFLLLVITIAVVVAVTVFIILALQIRRTAKEGEETLQEIRMLSDQLREIALKANEKIEDIDEIFQNARRTASSISEIALFLSTKFIKPSSKYWPFILPLIRMGLRQMKKRKEKKNGE